MALRSRRGVRTFTFRAQQAGQAAIRDPPVRSSSPRTAEQVRPLVTFESPAGLASRKRSFLGRAAYEHFWEGATASVPAPPTHRQAGRPESVLDVLEKGQALRSSRVRAR
jgi:hypothetical protein